MSVISLIKQATPTFAPAALPTLGLSRHSLPSQRGEAEKIFLLFPTMFIFRVCKSILSSDGFFMRNSIQLKKYKEF